MIARAFTSQLLGGGAGRAMPSRTRLKIRILSIRTDRAPKHRAHGLERQDAFTSHQELAGDRLLPLAECQRHGHLGNAG